MNDTFELRSAFRGSAGTLDRVCSRAPMILGIGEKGVWTTRILCGARRQGRNIPDHSGEVTVVFEKEPGGYSIEGMELPRGFVVELFYTLVRLPGCFG